MFPNSEISNFLNIVRSPFISSWRGLNTALDVTFYDVEALSADERKRLSTYSGVEGTIVVVHPRESGQDMTFMSPLSFVSGQENNTSAPVDALVVTGVGSSPLGTAALARNVADYINRPVGGIVSGLGMSDVIAESLGGWAVLGAKNVIRSAIARLLDAAAIRDDVWDQAFHEDMDSHFARQGIDRERIIFGSPDSTALLYILTKLHTRIKLLVGHSKGNYSIESSLKAWTSASGSARKDLDPDLTIITLGAAIWFPEEFRKIFQFVGQFDPLGILNSRPTTESLSVLLAFHSLNRLIPGNMKVSDALKNAGVH